MLRGYVTKFLYGDELRKGGRNGICDSLSLLDYSCFIAWDNPRRYFYDREKGRRSDLGSRILGPRASSFLVRNCCSTISCIASLISFSLHFYLLCETTGEE